ncbi:MAG: hypothetical protein CML05_14290 [Pseudozobellia sp.]|nr:hypothetical protein [Pseudozobellia sp.]
MLRTLYLPLVFFAFFFANAQREERLPADLRQHNLTIYNASLFNPAFSLDRNNPQSIAVWSRWQWQGIDADPTTIFLNYTRKLNNESAAGLAFIQQNTGIYFNTGGALNYAHQFELNELVKLSVGANVFVFQQELADNRFVTDPNLPIPMPMATDDFIVQMAPGLSLSVERLTLALASENLIDYNFTAKEGNTSKEDKIFMGLLSYDFPLTLGSATNAFLRPSMYLRTIPGQSNQIGLYSLLNTDKYWGQLGYNNFYGYGIGAGVTFFKHLSVGALVELGTGSTITKDASFELMAAYFLGKPEDRHKMVGQDINLEEEIPAELNSENRDEQIKKELENAQELAKNEKEERKEAKKQQKEEERELRKREKEVRDSLATVEKEAKLAAREIEKEEKAIAKAEQEQLAEQNAEKVQKEADALANQQAEQARKLDSINNAKQGAAIAEARRLAEERRKDSIAAIEEAKRKEALARQEEEAKPQAGEKYEEVKTEDGLEPGYYLIANVFGTKKYFDAFMTDLKSKGMNPGSFVRSKNNFNYAYLERFNTMQEARAARDSNYNGRYEGNTWIFRVVGN